MGDYAKDIVLDVVQAVQDHPLGPFYYVLFMGVWVTMCLPITILEILPGFIFGAKTGILVSVCGKNLGNYMSFFLGRYVFKDYVKEKFFDAYPVLNAFSAAVAKEPLKVAVLMRLAYLPMGMKNYGMSVMEIPWWKFGISCASTGLPFACIWSMIGASASHLEEIMSGQFTLKDAFPEEYQELLGNISAFVAFVGLPSIAYIVYGLKQTLNVELDRIQKELDDGKKQA